MNELNNKKQVVAIYSRVSTEEQAKWVSIEAQTETLIKYAKDRGYHVDIDDIYEEKWISWYYWRDKRPALDKLMYNSLVKRKYSKVLVWKIDRFARKTSLLLNLVEELIDNWISFVSYNEDLDFDTINWKMMLVTYWAMAEAERNNIRLRTAMWKANKSKLWYYTWWWKILKYWYDIEKDNIWNKLIVNQEEKKVINRIFNMYVDENKSIWEIVKILSSEKILTKFDKSFSPWVNKRKKSWAWVWNHMWVHSILKNTMLIWKYYYGIPDEKSKISVLKSKDKSTKKYAEMICPKILDDEKIFFKAQEKLEKNKREKVNKNSHNFVNLIKCWKCSMSYHWYKTSKWTISYRCWSRKNILKWIEKCWNIEISENILYNRIWREFSTILKKTDDYIEEYYNKTNNDNRSDNIKNELIFIDKEIAKVQWILTNAYNDLYSTTDEFVINIKEDLIKTTKQKYDWLVSRKEENNIKLKHFEDINISKKSIKSLYIKKKSILEKIDYKWKINLMREFIDKIEIHNNWQVNVKFRFEKSEDGDSDSSFCSDKIQVNNFWVLNSSTK